jgi:SAM-dependent methyltransferase
MVDTKIRAKRLDTEAEFQNRRVVESHQGQHEQRDRFYFLTERAMQAYQDALGDVRGQRVLVVGCSEGGVTPLARCGARVTGIDISSEAIEALTKNIHREGLRELADARVMDAETLTFPDNTFDLICCAGVLHHLDTAKATESWSRVLRPTGRVVMIEPMAWNPAVMLYRWLTPSMRTPDEHPLKPKDFKLMLGSYKEIKTCAFVLTSVLSLVWVVIPNILDMKHRTMRVLEWVDDQLLRIVPPLKYLCWTAVIQLSLPKEKR